MDEETEEERMMKGGLRGNDKWRKRRRKRWDERVNDWSILRPTNKAAFFEGGSDAGGRWKKAEASGKQNVCGK